ncbi:MAG TPA: hypothetical protein VNN08_08415 [Thermoanaerobaculia bacterium]|nr:hypothetical protein [Thermoanaerobaculia bacterium]
MSTGLQHHYDFSFERINAHIRRIDIPALITATAVESQPDRGKRLIAAYAAIRPILVALGAVLMIPANWRTALRIFTATLDEATVAFKAGKDLATTGGGPAAGAPAEAPSGSNVDMEPKLPVG